MRATARVLKPAWAVRNSSIDTGSGDDFVSLSASTFQTQWYWDPAYGADNSSIDLGSGNDTLLIDANAAGLGDIQAYGSLNSSIKTGRGDDIVSIKTVANGGWGEQEGQQKNSYNYSGSWDYNSSGSWGYSSNYSYDNRSNSSWGYRTSNNGNYTTEYSYTSTYDDSWRNKDQRMGRAFGITESEVSLGKGNDRLNLDVQGNDYSIGLGNSSLIAGSGDDELNINVLANGESSWMSRGSSSGSSSYISEGVSSGTSEYWGNYNYSWGLYRSSSNYHSNNAWKNSWETNTEYSWNDQWDSQYIHRFGQAIGSENSILSLGKGNDTATISVIGGESAKGLLNSHLDSSSGSDILKLTVRAEGGYTYNNRSNSSNIYDDRSVGNYSSSGFSNGSYNYENSHYINSINTNSWSYKDIFDRDVTSAYQYSQDYSQFTRNGSAIGVEHSTLNTGAGNDTAILEVVGGGEAVGLRESSIHSGSGNDLLSFSVRAEGEDKYQNSYTYSYSFDNDIIELGTQSLST